MFSSKTIDRILGLDNVVGPISFHDRLKWIYFRIKWKIPDGSDLFVVYVRMYIFWCTLRVVHAHLRHPNYKFWKIGSIIIARRNKIRN